MKYVLTPEFNRNLWLKISPFRLVVVPVFLAVCAVICLNIVPDSARPIIGMVSKNLAESNYAAGFIMHGALWFYFIIVMVWGNYEAGMALQEEMRSNTWDFQRMSSITPFQLVFGKLFGATSYIWYIGVLTLALFFYGFVNSDSAPMFDSDTRPALGNGDLMPLGQDQHAFYVVLFLLLAGLVGHALAFLISFVDMTNFTGKTGKKRIPRGSGAFAMGLLSSWYIFNLAKDSAPKLASWSSLFSPSGNVLWFGQSYTTLAFAACSLLFFLGWFWIGSYRIARAELMYRTYPTVWMVFVASLVTYFLGLCDPTDAYYFTQLLGVFFVAMVLTYAVMLFEASDGRKYSRFAYSVQQGDYRRAAENIHKWVVTVPFVAALYLLVVSYVPTSGKYITPAGMAAFMLAIILFAVRDGIVVHAFVRKAGGRNLAFKLLFYYLFAYVLLPTLHFALAPKDFDGNIRIWLQNFLDHAEQQVTVPAIIRSLGIYYPLPVSELHVSVVPAALEALAAGIWLFLGINRAKAQRAKT